MPTPTINVRNLQHLFRPDAIAAVIVQRQQTGYRALQRWFPAPVRRPWPSVSVPVEEIVAVTKSAPVVRRGSGGVSLTPFSGAINTYTPQPVKLHDVFTAVDFNNLQLFMPVDRQSYADQKTARMWDTVLKTADGMAAQAATTGKIDWPLYSDVGGIIGTAELDFDPNARKPTFTVTADWTHNNTKLETIINDLTAMQALIMRNGYSQMEVALGTAVFSAVLGKVAALSNDSRIEGKVERQDGQQVILLAGFRLSLENGQYWKPAAGGGQWTDIVSPDDVVMYATDAPWSFLWVKLDSFALGNQAMPLGITVKESDDGSDLNIYGQSKPVPIPAVTATIKTDATDPA